MLFRKNRAEFTDGVIDLLPARFTPPDPAMGFGRERIWKITLHNRREEIGEISYRNGESRCVYYFGHIGYHIDPLYRGHHYALRACRLLQDTIRTDGKSSVSITCDPDNEPSRKTCLRLGCLYEGVTDIPDDVRKKYEISAVKCRYIWRTGAKQDE